MDISVRELKNHLSSYLRLTQAGEAMNITSHGRPVGRLLPPRSCDELTESDAAEQLRALPGVRAGNGQRVQGGDRSVSVAPGTAEEITDWVRGG